MKNKAKIVFLTIDKKKNRELNKSQNYYLKSSSRLVYYPVLQDSLTQVDSLFYLFGIFWEDSLRGCMK